jgi:hypothetical protein
VQNRRKATGACRPGTRRSKAGKSAKLASTAMPALGGVEDAKHEASVRTPERLRLELPSASVKPSSHEGDLDFGGAFVRS